MSHQQKRVSLLSESPRVSSLSFFIHVLNSKNQGYRLFCVYSTVILICIYKNKYKYKHCSVSSFSALLWNLSADHSRLLPIICITVYCRPTHIHYPHTAIWLDNLFCLAHPVSFFPSLSSSHTAAYMSWYASDLDCTCACNLTVQQQQQQQQHHTTFEFPRENNGAIVERECVAK